jgi:predicted nucleotidyltransferase
VLGVLFQGAKIVIISDMAKIIWPDGEKFVPLQIEMDQEQVIQRIKELGEKILPEGASLWLYGSRARGDARPDSDYDLLILLDKNSLSSMDYNAVFDFRMLGVDIDEEINPTVYPKKQWIKWDYVPFHDNVEQDKIVLR